MGVRGALGGALIVCTSFVLLLPNLRLLHVGELWTDSAYYAEGAQEHAVLVRGTNGNDSAVGSVETTRTQQHLAVEDRTSQLEYVAVGSTRPDRREDAKHTAAVADDRPSLLRMLGEFPWSEAASAVEKGDTEASLVYTQRLLNALTPYVILEPDAGVDEQCGPSQLQAKHDIDCKRYPAAFTGRRRKTAAKVAHVIQLGFDADILEVTLNELDDVVDWFFIIESTRTHNKGLVKPLIWDRLKNQRRFEKFRPKTVHLVLDDVRSMVANEEGGFALECAQERLRWERFSEWNNHTGFFAGGDVIGFGDADEIPSRENVHLLRHCEMLGQSVDIGSWTALGGLGRAFRPDWPVPGNPWTLGDPTYWTVASATRYFEEFRAQRLYPSRMRGRSGHYLLGGIHMTDNPYIPFGLAKAIACTECSDKVSKLFGIFKDSVAGLAMGYKEAFVSRIMDAFDISVYFSKDRIAHLPSNRGVLGDAYHVPWFVACNPGRFAGWHGHVDARNLS